MNTSRNRTGKAPSGKKNQDKRKVEPDEGARFLNPYTFMPTPRRDGWPEPLGDALPHGHDRLHEGGWTGSIKVRLRVETPLLLLDAARAFPAPTGKDGHLRYPMLLRNGSPHLPATSVKGMLRSAYEIITNSRFGVFDEWKKPLGWRRIVSDAQHMRPVRIVSDGGNGLRVQFCKAVRLPRYDKKQVRYPDGSLPQYGDEVWIHASGRQLTANKTSGRRPTVDKIVKGPRPSGADWTRGYVFVSGENIGKKKHERVFIPTNTFREVTQELRERWDMLMCNYRATHTEKELEGFNTVSDTNKPLEWSAHLKDPERARLEEGTLCYAYMLDETVEGLYPVAIPRDITLLTPVEMLPESLHPAPDINSLSPADRLFGWVAPKGSSTRPAGYRGRLRVGPVQCEESEKPHTTKFNGDGLPLAILGNPKPSQGRFYFAIEDGGEKLENPPRNRVAKTALYLSGRSRLRGRKVYWHHATTAGNATYWSEPRSSTDPTQERIGVGYREFRRPGPRKRPIKTLSSRRTCTSPRPTKSSATAKTAP